MTSVDSPDQTSNFVSRDPSSKSQWDSYRSQSAQQTEKDDDDVDGDDDDDDDDDDSDDPVKRRRKLVARQSFIDDLKETKRYALEELEDEDDSHRDEHMFGLKYDMYLFGTKRRDFFSNVWHIILIMCGLCFFIMGVALRYHFGDYLNYYVKNQPEFKSYKLFITMANVLPKVQFGGYMQRLGTLMIQLNATYVICQLGYVTYSVHRYTLTLPVLCIICTLVSILETAVVHVSYKPSISQDQNVINTLQNRIVQQYKVKGTDDFSVSYDYIAIWLECCGIVNEYDFSDAKLTFGKSMTSSRTVQVAPTCCNKTLFSDKSGEMLDRVMKCVSTAKDIYKDGCFTKLTLKIESFCKYYIPVIIAHIIDCFVHAYIYKKRVVLLERAVRDKFEVESDEKLA